MPSSLWGDCDAFSHRCSNKRICYNTLRNAIPLFLLQEGSLFHTWLIVEGFILQWLYFTSNHILTGLISHFFSILLDSLGFQMKNLANSNFTHVSGSALSLWPVGLSWKFGGIFFFFIVLSVIIFIQRQSGIQLFPAGGGAIVQYFPLVFF